MPMHRPLRVVHVIDSLRGGGAERQLRALVERSAHDHDVVELPPRHKGVSPTLAHVRDDLARLRPDVVMAWLDRSQIAVALVRPPCPRIANVRGAPRRYSPRTAWPLRLALATYHEIIVNSDSTRHALQTFSRPLRLPRVTTIPNGVDTPPPHETRSRRRDLLRIGFIGRANHAKGPDVLIDALRHLEGAPIEATLIGAGIPQFVADYGGLAPRHRVLPHARDPWAALWDVDALVVPSRSEGSPNVVLEAFVRGIPVIATTAGGTAALGAGGRAVLVPPESPVELAKAIEALSQQPPRAVLAMATAAREYAVRAHAWPRVVAGYDLLFLAARDQQ